VKLRRTSDEIARRGDLLYEREVAPHVSTEDTGCFVAIDVESGVYEIDRHELTAIHRLLAQKPDAQIWLRRVGKTYTHRIRRRVNASARSVA
jgi:hypothetical protein